MAFKMRSGNGPLAFKSMGSSSPAKEAKDLDEVVVDGGNYTYNLPPVKPKPLNVEVGDKPIEATKTFKETSAEIKAEKEAKPKKHQAQIRKQKRLDKITARRKKKGKEGLSSRQIRLQGEVDKTAEQFVSDRKAKLQKVGDFAIQIGRQISGDSKGITTSLEDSTANRLNEAANAKKIALQKTVDNKEAVLPKTNQGAVTAEGANLEPAKITTTNNSATRAVQRQKDLDKQIADDKAKMEKELGINQV